MLIGIFWTRLGSPTGVADSGTLEEIERVGTAGKPIMLYFSRVEIDPEKIDITQIEKLNAFKKKTYPQGLVENYRKIIEFRDKFARQLELKVRELQRGDTAGKVPLSLTFMSLDKKGKSVGNVLNRKMEYFAISDFNGVPEEKFKAVKEIVDRTIKLKATVPVALGIENVSASGIRNLYVEMEFSSVTKELELADSVRWPKGTNIIWTSIGNWFLSGRDKASNEFGNQIAELIKSDGFQKTENGWSVSFEWEALQPQRLRLIQPVLFLYSPVSAILKIQAKVFQPKSVPLSTIIPDWQEGLSNGEYTPRALLDYASASENA